MFQFDNVMIPNMRKRKFQINHKSLTSLLFRKFSDSNETEEESEEDDVDINYDQVPIIWKLKVNYF